MATQPQNSDLTFPPADVVGELHPETNTNVQIDPTSSEVTAYKETKAQNEVKDEKEKKDALQTIKSAIVISGIVVALAGAAFAIAKKLREK